MIRHRIGRFAIDVPARFPKAHQGSEVCFREIEEIPWPTDTRADDARIDHILVGPGWRPHRCWVGPALRSDHLPLIADLRWD